MAEVNPQPTANPYAAPAGEPGDSSAQAGPTPKKWAEKYPTPEELEQGHRHLQHTLTERNNQLAESNKRVEELSRMLEAVAERMSPAARTRERSRAEEALENLGIPVDSLLELVDQRVSSTGPKMVESVLAPLTQGAQAQERLAEEFPDVNQNDVIQFLRANPEIQAQYNAKLQEGKTSEAMYFAIAQFERFSANSPDLSGAAAAAERARRDAQLPTGRSGGAPESTDNPVAAGWDRYTQTGNVMEFLRERLAHIPGIKPQT